MKILYGVQATGQGHISRARAMAEAFRGLDIEVQWLFSGREQDRLFDMEPFGNFLHRRGLTFTTGDGGIRHLRTVLDNNLFRFMADVVSLDLDGYDLIITDFEPVTAWAGRLRGVRTVGIGHQYAFGEKTPKHGDRWLPSLIMRNFAPVDIGLGLHWDRFDQTTVPPILDLDHQATGQGEHFLVYLPFENQQRVTRFLQQFRAHRFIQYAPGLDALQQGNVQTCPASISGFKRDLASCRGVICNSGFELSSECLQLGKPILTKPLAGQMEQLSNALALEQLGYANTMGSLCKDTVANWLAQSPEAPRIQYPDVAASLAHWLADQCREHANELSERLWRSTIQPTRSPQSYPGARNLLPALG